MAKYSSPTTKPILPWPASRPIFLQKFRARRGCGHSGYHGCCVAVEDDGFVFDERPALSVVAPDALCLRVRGRAAEQAPEHLQRRVDPVAGRSSYPRPFRRSGRIGQRGRAFARRGTRCLLPGASSVSLPCVDQYRSSAQAKQQPQSQRNPGPSLPGLRSRRCNVRHPRRSKDSAMFGRPGAAKSHGIVRNRRVARPTGIEPVFPP